MKKKRKRKASQRWRNSWDYSKKKENTTTLRFMEENAHLFLELKTEQKKNKSTPYYAYINSKEWEAKKKDYYSRHFKICAICSSIKRINLHHATYREFGKEKDEDLVPLCSGCHSELHRTRGKEKLKEHTFSFIEDSIQEQKMYELSHII